MTRHFEPAFTNPADVGEALRRTGIQVSSTEIVVERRGERALVTLPGERLAWFATMPGSGVMHAASSADTASASS